MEISSRARSGWEKATVDQEATICWKNQGDFPGHPVIKTSPSNAVGAVLISGQEAKIPHALWPKNQNIKQNIVTNSIKTLKIATSKKKKIKEEE